MGSTPLRGMLSPAPAVVSAVSTQGKSLMLPSEKHTTPESTAATAITSGMA